MVKLKIPLISLGAVGRLTKSITFKRKNKQAIAEKMPDLIDVQSDAQLSWRTMFLLARDLWHELSAAEKAAWESAGTARHMTGYAWFISQALRPNPGLYLPLLGGKMQGEIDMDGHRIEDLPDPVAAQDPLTLAYYTANIAPFLYHEGARVFSDAPLVIPNNVGTNLTFNGQRYDTDNIHSTVGNTDRLTCRTAGVYVVSGHIQWEGAAAGFRNMWIRKNEAVTMGEIKCHPTALEALPMSIPCVFLLAVDDFITLVVSQTSGAPKTIFAAADKTPFFAMQRIG